VTTLYIRFFYLILSLVYFLTEKVQKARNEVKHLIYKVVTEKVHKTQNEVNNLIYKVVTEEVHKTQNEVKQSYI
jgi:hypothetical protein